MDKGPAHDVEMLDANYDSATRRSAAVMVFAISIATVRLAADVPRDRIAVDYLCCHARAYRIESAGTHSDDDEDEHAGAHQDVARPIEAPREACRTNTRK